MIWNDLTSLIRWIKEGNNNGRHWRAAAAHRAGALDGTSGGAAAISEPRATARVDRFDGLDFAVGYVRGMRSFAVDSAGYLTGVVYRDRWHPGENVKTCFTHMPSPGSRHINLHMYHGTVGTAFSDSKEHPMDRCCCGFYGFYEGSNDYGRSNRVSAIIEGYGETIVGTKGFRCEKARIIALHFGRSVTAQQERMIRANYPDVRVFQYFSNMVKVYPQGAVGMEHFGFES